MFRYLDTASSRAGISLLTGKLAVPKVAIVGLGGTGAYILDLVAKTPVSEIHLFDGDDFLRTTPSARRAPRRSRTDAMPRTRSSTTRTGTPRCAAGSSPTPTASTSRTSANSTSMAFVFLAIDDGPGKRSSSRS